MPGAVIFSYTSFLFFVSLFLCGYTTKVKLKEMSIGFHPVWNMISNCGCIMSYKWPNFYISWWLKFNAHGVKYRWIIATVTINGYSLLISNISLILFVMHSKSHINPNASSLVKTDILDITTLGYQNLATPTPHYQHRYY